jgi:hypothetical protein
MSLYDATFNHRSGELDISVEGLAQRTNRICLRDCGDGSTQRLAIDLKIGKFLNLI